VTRLNRVKTSQSLNRNRDKDDGCEAKITKKKKRKLGRGCRSPQVTEKDQFERERCKVSAEQSQQGTLRKRAVSVKHGKIDSLGTGLADEGAKMLKGSGVTGEAGRPRQERTIPSESVRKKLHLGKPGRGKVIRGRLEKAKSRARRELSTG